jgi:phage terminase large subunit-like protein
MDKKQELFESLIAKKRLKGLEDLLFFNKYILEDDTKRRKLLVDHVHGEWVRWYSGSKNRIKMILVPRACFKSTFFTVGKTLQAICQNRDARVLIANATLGNSQKFLGEIKNHLRKNTLLNELYGGEKGFFEKSLKWNEDEIEVTGRSLGAREPTVTAAGVGGNLVSQHYSLIIADDLMNLENSSTRYQVDKVVDWWARAFSLLDYDGEMIVIGTRWSYYDLYSYIQDKFADKADIYIRGAKLPDGSLYFPEMLSEEKLEELKSLQGSYIYSSFYLNDPVDEDSALIKRDQIRYWGDGDNELPSRLNFFACCDPAVSQDVSADESSITIVGVDVNNDWYVMETRSGKWTVGQLITELFAVNDLWQPIGMSIEVIGQAQGLMTPIYDEENRRNKFLPLKEIKARPQVTKEMRIRSVLQPRFERGKVFIKKDMYDLEEQILKFPKSKRDDLLDSLTDIEEISFPAEPQTKTFESTGNFFQDILKKQKLGLEKNTDEFMGTHW